MTITEFGWYLMLLRYSGHPLSLRFGNTLPTHPLIRRPAALCRRIPAREERRGIRVLGR